MLADERTRTVIHKQWTLPSPAHHTDVQSAYTVALSAREAETGMASDVEFEIEGGEPDATCPRCISALALAAESFWPPQRGDVWLGNLGERIPNPLVCGAEGRLYVGGDGMAAERAWDNYGPLRLVWRDGALVTAMHASELTT